MATSVTGCCTERLQGKPEVGKGQLGQQVLDQDNNTALQRNTLSQGILTCPELKEETYAFKSEGSDLMFLLRELRLQLNFFLAHSQRNTAVNSCAQRKKHYYQCNKKEICANRLNLLNFCHQFNIFTEFKKYSDAVALNLLPVNFLKILQTILK